MKRIITLLAFALALATLGCGSKFMIEARAPMAFAPDPAAATVIFIRPSRFASAIRPAILDERGTFLGEALPSSHFAVRVTPGEHLFVAWSEGTPALRATLEGGKFYYVEIGIVPGVWSARARLFAVGPGREQWAKLPEWLADSRMMVLPPEAARAFMEAKGDGVREVVSKGQSSYADYEQEARRGDPTAVQKRTLVLADGVPQPVR
jgi:hypothetical protein